MIVAGSSELMPVEIVQNATKSTALPVVVAEHDFLSCTAVVVVVAVVIVVRRSVALVSRMVCCTAECAVVSGGRKAVFDLCLVTALVPRSRRSRRQAS